MNKSIIMLVVGRHRSGTSIAAGVLHHLGVSMGDRLRWNHWANPRGNFEDLDFHELFKKMQPDWRRPRHLAIDRYREEFDEVVRRRCEAHKLWGVKDARLCYLLDLFLAEPAAEVKVVATERSLEDSVASLCNWFSTLAMPEARMLCQDCDIARLEALDKYKPPVFWAPFDAWTNPDQIRELADFVGVPYREEAAEFVDPLLDHFGAGGSAHRLVRFRRMLPEDANRGLGELVKQLVASRAPSLSESRMVARVQQIIDDGGQPWVAEEGGAVVATATLHVHRKLVHGGSAVAYIDDVVTREDCRGRGIARTLVQTLSELARRRGCYKAMVNCREEAGEFYERCGFSQDGWAKSLRFRGEQESLSEKGS